MGGVFVDETGLGLLATPDGRVDETGLGLLATPDGRVCDDTMGFRVSIGLELLRPSVSTNFRGGESVAIRALSWQLTCRDDPPDALVAPSREQWAPLL